MDSVEISRNPKLLKALTAQEYEQLDYAEQIEKLKGLRKAKKDSPVLPTEPLF